MNTSIPGENRKVSNGLVNIGDVFSDRLTVIRQVDGRARKWVCRCICGNEIEAYQTDLFRKKVVSCGCIKPSNLVVESASSNASHRRKDLTGQVFSGCLTAVQLEGVNSSGNSVWSFRCVCGNTITRTARQVVRGDIKSCGCRKKSLLKAAATLPNQQALKNAAYRIHKKAAEKRKIVSDLSQTQYEALIVLPCRYCGEFFMRTNWGTLEKSPLNSVDRLNNEPYYRLENSVPACMDCQQAKSDKTEADFKAHIIKCYNHMKLGES